MTSTRYFQAGWTASQVKKEFHRPAMIHHPDRGGDNDTMRIIIEQYKMALKRADGEVVYDRENDREYTYTYNEQREAEVIEFINRLCSSGVLAHDVESMLIGTWVWLVGDTKPIKDLLNRNGLGMVWHDKRSAWYWKPAGKRHYYNKNVSLEGLARQYGATKLVGKHKEGAAQIAA